MNIRAPVIRAQVGPLDVDVPRTAGYYGAVGLALGLGLIEWPVAALIASIPLVKLLRGRRLPRPVTFGIHVFEGAAKPVGGDAEGTVALRAGPSRQVLEEEQAVVIPGPPEKRAEPGREAPARPARRRAGPAPARH